MKKTEQSHNSTLRCVSLKKAKQMKEEAAFAHALKGACQYKCQFCGADYHNDIGNLDKHEIVFRSHGGDPLDRLNTVILCRINKTSNPWTEGCHQLAQKGLITKKQLYAAKIKGVK